MSEAELAAAKLLERAGKDVAGIVGELIAAAQARDAGVDLKLITGEIVGVLLIGAWKLTMLADLDRKRANAHFVSLLRNMAQNIENGQ